MTPRVSVTFSGLKPGEITENVLNIKVAYLVESLPDIDFDVAEMYSGLIPIDMSNALRALFFVFQPTINANVDEITIWLNGGPGNFAEHLIILVQELTFNRL